MSIPRSTVQIDLTDSVPNGRKGEADVIIHFRAKDKAVITRAAYAIGFNMSDLIRTAAVKVAREISNDLDAEKA